jgi:hypothetical protein
MKFICLIEKDKLWYCRRKLLRFLEVIVRYEAISLGYSTYQRINMVVSA